MSAQPYLKIRPIFKGSQVGPCKTEALKISSHFKKCRPQDRSTRAAFSAAFFTPEIKFSPDSQISHIKVGSKFFSGKASG